MAGPAHRGGSWILILSAAGCLLAGVLVAMSLGWTRPVARYLRDTQLRTWPREDSSDQIVQIVLDDASIEQFGRFPWPRADQAGICQALTDAGARMIALDITLHEPQAPRARVEPDGSFELVFDDRRLAEAIRRARLALLAMHIRPDTAGLSRVQQASLALSRPGGPGPAELAEQFGLNADQLQAARRREAAARAIARRSALPINADGIQAGYAVAPTLQIARRTDRAGFVTLQAGSDEMTRAATLLLADEQGNVYGHFALLLAAEHLADTHGRPWRIAKAPSGLRRGDHVIRLVFPDGFTRQIPTGPDLQMAIRWGRGPEQDPATRRISISLPARIHANRKAIAANDRLARILRGRLARLLGQDGLLELLEARRKLDEQIRAVLQDLAASLAPRPPARLQDQLAELEDHQAALDLRIDQQAAELLDPFYLESIPRDDPLHGRIEKLQAQLRQIDQANGQTAALIDTQLAKLASWVDGKVCLVGSSATALGDFVPTPIDRRTPGMEVHHQIFQGIVTGHFLRRPARWVDWAVLAVLALAATVLAGRLHVAVAAGGLIVLAAAWAVVNGAVLLDRYGLVVVLAEPLIAMGLGFVVVTAWRQLIDQRQRRRLRGMFAHALSGQLVDRLLAHPEMAQLGGRRREVTVLFSDLQGFTSLAERLGEQKSVGLLNRYFDRMTDVIQHRHQGYLNKFMGDGILALFGAPVELADHAAAALRAAVQTQQDLARLNAQLPELLGLDVELRCRVGIATGQAIVGNCGSSDRMDWTAIGDAVNLASRLEGANKFFATGVLVTESNWQAAGLDGDLLARPLGPIRVVGRVEPASVVHVLGPLEQAGDETRRNVQRFTEAMQLYLAGRFAEAAEILDGLAEAWPDDRPSRLFADRARRLADQPPESLPPVLELTSK